MGLAPVFTGIFSNVPVEFSQQEIIFSTVRTVAHRLLETKKWKTRETKTLVR